MCMYVATAVIHSLPAVIFYRSCTLDSSKSPH